MNPDQEKYDEAPAWEKAAAWIIVLLGVPLAVALVFLVFAVFVV